MDALYVYKHSPHDDFEIRHSLRSLERYAPYLRKVWIYGDCPGFLSGDTTIVERVPHEATSRVIGAKLPVTNFFLLMFLSSLIPDLSSEYLFLCDDFFLLKDYPPEEARKDRFNEDMTKKKIRGRGLWLDGLWRTYDLLIRLGYTGYNFETHTPAYMTKKRVMDAFCEFKDFVTEDPWYGILGLTAVLNHAYRNERMPLTNLLEENSRCGFWGRPPTREELEIQSAGKAYFNFDEPAFGDVIRAFLEQRFPDRSKYEKE
jgi:hypothetical protein